MQPLNAIDALAPAFTRTHETLFHPFKLGRSWKLAASSYLGFAGAMFIPFPFFFLLIPTSAIPGFAAIRAFMLLATIVPTLIYLVILYFCARMELVVFEMVVTRAKFIAPMWRRYSGRIWPWLGFKILVGTVYTALVAAILYAPMKHLIEGLMATIAALPVGPETDPNAMMERIAPLIAEEANLQFAWYGILFLLKVPSTLLNDFVLPYYVLEDIPLFAAIGRGFQVFVADPIQVILYLILKPILFIIGYIMMTISIMIAAIPVAIVAIIGVVIVALIGGASMRHSSGIGAAAGGGLLFFAGIALLYLVAIAFFTYLGMGIGGYLVTILEAYGIYFLGGRYPLLGNMLEPGPGAPFTPPPVFPSPEERQDSDGGPPMPMNPAVA